MSGANVLRVGQPQARLLSDLFGAHIEYAGPLIPVIGLLEALAETHRTLWYLEDRSRSSNATASEVADTKRQIDQENARRHHLIGSIVPEVPQIAASAGTDLHRYSETVGELCDRLIILGLKLEHLTLAGNDATLTPAARSRCIEKCEAMRAWRRYLQARLGEMIADALQGRAEFPPRAEFKMYNDPELARSSDLSSDDGTISSSRLIPRSHRAEHILGIASTGHGASLAYLSNDGIMRASVLDRWSSTKHVLLFSGDEAGDIVQKRTPTDAGIHEILSLDYGAFPPYVIFEDVFQDWLHWLLQGTGVRAADIDLVVTSDSYFATASHRLGPSLRRWLPNAEVHWNVEHHQVHRAQAFWASGFDEAAVLTLDTCGEGLARVGGRKLGGTIALMRRDGSCVVLKEFLFPHASAGLLYSMVTRQLGFRDGDEGKTMGLAPYGALDVLDEWLPHLRLYQDGSFEFVTQRALQTYLDLCVPRRDVDGSAPLTDQHRAAARAVQALIDLIVTNAFRAALDTTNQQRLAYAGGVALNSVANAVAYEASNAAELYIPPNPGDTGQALGCALVGAYEIAGWDPPGGEFPEYLGPGYGESEIQATLQGLHGLVITHEDEVPGFALADCIARGQIVAWFRGGSEFGPRALGNRSILADPRRPNMAALLNERVKHREGFRPFAPSVLVEHASDWFELEEPSPYMLRVVPVRPERRRYIPAVVHVDGTARVQTVDHRENPSFYRLILDFFRETDVPLLLNTSFNVAGKPIVETPRAALKCFLGSEIDVLVLNDWIVSRRPLVQLRNG
jgi:carbamoyltransferase